MHIEIIKPWSFHRVGRLLEVGGGFGDILIRRKFAREVVPQVNKKVTGKKVKAKSS